MTPTLPFGTVRRAAVPALAGAALLVLVGCSASTPAAGPTTVAETTAETTTDATTDAAPYLDLLPAAIQDAGVLRIGVSANFPPGNFEGDDGELDGSEIQLGLALAPHLGVEIEHVTTNFAGLLSGLQADRFDVVLSGMSDTLEREQEATFVNYLSTGSNFLVGEGNPHGIDTPQDLCGLVAAETIGTSYIDVVTGFSADCEAAGEASIDVQTFQSGTEVSQAVATGRADFSLASMMANNYFASQSDGALESVGETINPQLTGFVVPLGEDELVEALQAVLQSMIDSGEMEELMVPWGLESQVLPEVMVNGATS